MTVKALFFGFDKTPFRNIEQLIQIAKNEAPKVLGTDKVEILNIISCSYPLGYVVVVQNPGRRKEQKENK